SRNEVLAPPPALLALLVSLVPWRVPCDEDVIDGSPAAQQTDVGQARRSRAGQAFEPLQQSSLKRYKPRGRVPSPRIKPEERYIFTVEAGVQILQILQAADEQPRADEQKE